MESFQTERAIEEQGKNQVKALEVLKPNTQKLSIKNVILKNTLKQEAKNELNTIQKIEKMVYRENVVYRTN